MRKKYYVINMILVVVFLINMVLYPIPLWADSSDKKDDKLLLKEYQDSKEKSNQLSPKKKQEVIEYMKKMSLPFIKNEGQVEGGETVAFYARTCAGCVFVTKDGQLVYSNVENNDPNREDENDKNIDLHNSSKFGINKSRNQDLERSKRIQVLREVFVGENAITPVGIDKADNQINYVMTDSNWKENVANYNKLSLGEVYKGINIELKAYANNIEKVFFIQPGSSPDEIAVRFDEAKGLDIQGNGELDVKTDTGKMSFTAPVAYQEIDGLKKYVPVKFRLIDSEGCIYGFEVGEYDKHVPLVIDPLLASTFLGTDSDVSDIKILGDSIYVTGGCYDGTSRFPIKSSSSYNWSNGIIYIAKINEDLTNTNSCVTFLGNIYDDCSSCAMVTSPDCNYFYLCGTISINDLDIPNILTPGTFGYNKVNNSNYWGLILKVNTNLTSSGFLATCVSGSGSGYVMFYDLAITSDGNNIYLTGATSSDSVITNMNTSANVFDSNYSGGFIDGDPNDTSGSSSAIVVKTDNNFATCTISYIGGNQYTCGYAIDLSADNKYVFIYGDTTSNSTTDGFPGNGVTINNSLYYQTFGGTFNAFIVRLGANLQYDSDFAWTYLGGTGGYTYSGDMVVSKDGSNTVYINGSTNCADFPTSRSGSISNDVAFIAKFDISLMKSSYDSMWFDYCNVVGNPEYCGRLALYSGYIYCILMPCPKNKDDIPCSNCYSSPQIYSNVEYSDIVIVKIRNDLIIDPNFMAASIAESNINDSEGLAVDQSGVYLVGDTESLEFPVTEGTIQTQNTSSIARMDGFIAKFDLNLTEASCQIVTQNIDSNTITFSSVIASANITDLGLINIHSSGDPNYMFTLAPPSITQHGFVWDTSPAPLDVSLSTQTQLGPVSQTGVFSDSNIIGLSLGTQYYIRPYLTYLDSKGVYTTIYGDMETFTTLGSTQTLAPAPNPTPTSALIPTSTPNPTPTSTLIPTSTTTPTIGNGYYQDADASALDPKTNKIRVDSFKDKSMYLLMASSYAGDINEYWGIGTPAWQVGIDGFGVRYTGKIGTINIGGGDYQFAIQANGNVRLWVNNQLIINRWQEGEPNVIITDYGTAKGLTADTLYDFKLEYYKTSGNASVVLLWEPPGTSAFTIIPTTEFYKPDYAVDFTNSITNLQSNATSISQAMTATVMERDIERSRTGGNKLNDIIQIALTNVPVNSYIRNPVISFDLILKDANGFDSFFDLYSMSFSKTSVINSNNFIVEKNNNSIRYKVIMDDYNSENKLKIQMLAQFQPDDKFSIQVNDLKLGILDTKSYSVLRNYVAQNQGIFEINYEMSEWYLGNASGTNFVKVINPLNIDTVSGSDSQYMKIPIEIDVTN